MFDHLCHARDCTKVVPPRMLMCGHHWRMVPKHLQQVVWMMYEPGQETRKDPSMTYLRAAELAIEAVAVQEGIRT